jgi:hypothetical protein
MNRLHELPSREWNLFRGIKENRELLKEAAAAAKELAGLLERYARK